ncbi:MAG: hypothetical protein ACI8V2_004775 [Candidatus Latescibacterota bacterium]
MIVFTDEVELFIPPKKGKKHVLRVIRELLYFRPKRRGTSVEAALEYLNRVTRRRSVAFLVSDFMADGYEKALRIANKRHDLIAVALSDPREEELPNIGIVELEDAETGEGILVDFGDAEVRRLFSQMAIDRAEKRAQMFRKVGVDTIEIGMQESYTEPLMRFFKTRMRKRRA